MNANGFREVLLPTAERERYRLEPDDLLAFRVNGSRWITGQAVRYARTEAFAFCDHFIRIRTKPELLDSRMAELLFRAPSVRDQIERGMVTTAGQNTISQKTLNELEVPLPPLNEQRRIVAKIDALMARSRRAKESLDAIPPLLERLRQSILAAAFRGDLTADWRAQNPDVEPAEKLLERIRTERRRRWEEATLEKMRAKGKAPTGDGWKVKYEEPPRLEDEELPTLPATWAWATAESCASEITVGHVGPMASRYVVRGIPFLRSQNVRENRFDPTGLTFIAPEFDAELPKSRVNPGDVLVVRSGAPGTACVAPAELGVANCADLVIVRPLPHINAHLLCRFLNSTFGRSRTRDEQVGVAQQHFNVGSMKRTAIPILPVAEQTELERRLTALMDYVSNLEATTRALEPDCIRLDRAILAKAFRGELVPQDPNDEPAEQMLARLASTETPTKAKRGRPRQKDA